MPQFSFQWVFCAFLPYLLQYNIYNFVPFFGLLYHKHFSYYQTSFANIHISDVRQCFTGCTYCLIILLQRNTLNTMLSHMGFHFFFSFSLLLSLPPFLNSFPTPLSFPSFLSPCLSFSCKYSKIKFLLATQGLCTAIFFPCRTLSPDLQREALGT